MLKILMENNLVERKPLKIAYNFTYYMGHNDFLL
jgi:hypothetical protein